MLNSYTANYDYTNVMCKIFYLTFQFNFAPFFLEF